MPNDLYEIIDQVEGTDFVNGRTVPVIRLTVKSRKHNYTLPLVVELTNYNAMTVDGLAAALIQHGDAIREL